jgi:peptide/nickel transport system substrate-binding protein
MSTILLRQFVIFICLAAILLIAAACVPAPAPVQPIPPAPANATPLPVIPTPASQVDKTGGKWRIQIAEEPPTMDPQKSAAAVTALIWRYLGDPLVAKNYKNEYVPGLATEWQVSDDGLTWTFKLRDGVKFHDGTPLNAAAVVQTFKRALDPATKSPIAGSSLGPVASIETTGEMTFALKLKTAFAPFLENLTDYGRLSILSPTQLKGSDEDVARKPVSTGPWKFKEWVTADHITLVRNPDYNWGPSFVHQGPAYLDELTFRIMPEAATAQAAFEAGEIDQVNVAPADVKRMKDNKKYQLVSFMRKGVGLFLEFNVTKAPFDDLTVRQAFNYALDKQTIVDVALEGLGRPAYGPLPPSILGYWDGIVNYAPHYDKAKAAELLDKAGWTLNKTTGVREKDGKPFTFTLYSQPTDTWKASAQLVQSQLKELGIAMDIQSFEFGTLLTKLKAGEQQAGFMGYTYTTADIFDIWFHSKNIGTGLTLSRNSEPELDKMIEESQKTIDWNKRFEIYKNIQTHIVDRALWVPLWINDTYFGLQARVMDAKVHPDGYMVLVDAYLPK